MLQWDWQYLFHFCHVNIERRKRRERYKKKKKKKKKEVRSPFPAISGAEPWMGSYKPRDFSLREAEGKSPKDPGIMEASSVKMSPKRFCQKVKKYKY